MAAPAATVKTPPRRQQARGVPCAYYLTTGKHPEREKGTEEQLEKAGAPFCKVIAPAPDSAEDLSNEGRARMGPGEISCTAGHLKIWRQIAEGARPWVLVVEDDVELRCDWARVCELAGDLPAGWQVALLSRHWLAGKGHPAHPFRDHRREETRHFTRSRLTEYGTHCYLVSQAGARFCMERFAPIGRVVDNYFRFFAHYGRFYQARQPVGFTRDLASLLEPTRRQPSAAFSIGAPEIAFVVMVCSESARCLGECLASIRAHYPPSEAAIDVILDGRPTHRDLEAEGRRYDARIEPWEWLKGIRDGARWWHRGLSVAMRHYSKWIVKLDPDTRLLRRLRLFPGKAFGNYQQLGRHSHLQGGFQVFSWEAADALSMKATKGEFASFPYWNNSNPALAEKIASGEIATDFVLMQLLKECGIAPSHSPEIASYWKRPGEWPADAAVIHPVKE